MDAADTLLQAVLAKPEFKKAGKRSDLLSYLVEHLNEYVMGEAIWQEAFKNDPNTYQYGQSMRERVSDLRKALKDAFPPLSSGPRFELEGVPGKGWRITFLAGNVRNTEAFWKPHFDDRRELIIVINQPLFFRDQERRLVFRGFGVDPESEVTHKGVLKRLRPDIYKESLEAVQPYLLNDEVSARDAIGKFFLEATGLACTNAVSSRVPDDIITKASLILLGDSGINRFIDSLESGEIGADMLHNIGWLAREDFLPYRIVKRSDTAKYGCIRIYGATETEKRLFPGGLTQETTGAHGQRVEIYSLENDPARVVYGVVTRMVNPYNTSPVTIVGCLFSEAIEQMARLLTEEPLLSKFASTLSWQSGELPRAFQGLFAVRLGARNLDAGALSPQMVCWRDLMAQELAHSTQAGGR